MAKLKKRIHKDTLKLAAGALKKAPKIDLEKAKKPLIKRKVEEAKKKKADHFRPPAADEWKGLQEGDTRSHYNFFKLQADEFLSVIHRKQEQVQPILDKWLASFNSLLASSKASEDKWDITEPMPWMKKVVLPFDVSIPGLKGVFKYVPPKCKAVFIGSHSLKTSAPRDNTISVDAAVEMPKEFFQSSDYLNFAYPCKKALYMCYIMVLARKAKLFDATNCTFNYLEDNNLLPVLVIPVDQTQAKININVVLHFYPEQGVFKLNRFIPNRNNIRAVALGTSLSTEDEASLNTAPTYHYNNSVLRDCVLMNNHNLCETLISRFGSVSDALVLLKYWLRRRGLDSALTSNSLNMLMCHLIKSKKVNPAAMTYYQIIRIFFSHFHLTDMTKEISLCDANAATGPTPTPDDFRKHSDLCFLDVTGFLNFFSDLQSGDMKRLILESGRSLQMLDKSHTNAFQWLFLTETPATVAFDDIFHVECTEKLTKKLLKSEAKHLGKVLLFGLDTQAYLSDLIIRTLNKGLDNRVKLVQSIRSSSASWSVAESTPRRKNVLTFGVILDPEHAFEVIIKGPQANDPAAVEFREFWGELSQLRRFKDGAVTEACVFGSSQDSPTEKRSVTSRIIEHLLTVHLDFLKGKQGHLWRHHYYSNQLTCAMKPLDRKHEDITDLETQSLAVLRVFNEVEMELRRLEGLPLEITGILGVSPIFYYCDPKRNMPNGFCSRENGSTEVIFGKKIYDAVLTLAISGRWPDDLQAIQRLKAAFYMEIASKLQHIKGFFVRVAVDSISILRNGYTFRFVLAHAKELQLRRQLTIDGVVAYRDTRESLNMEKELFVKPTLASALAGLHRQHNGYGPTVCLVKSWLNSQLLDSAQWPDECTELIVASLFMDYSKTVTSEDPVQPQTGFLRFLHLMANKNWETEFVLLNFNETLSPEKIDEIQSSFTMKRSQFPPVTIITPFDEKFTGIWGKEAPILQVLIRVMMLSKELLQQLTQKVEQRENFNNESVFLTQFSGYDVVISLNVANVKFLPGCEGGYEKRLPVDFDPVGIYLRELRSAYGEVALFFYNSIKPQKIGVLWKPAVDLPRDFRISDVNSRYLVDKQLVFDKKAICNDFLIIGSGLAVNVQ